MYSQSVKQGKAKVMKKGIDLVEVKNSTWGKALSILIAVIMAVSIFAPLSLAYAAETPKSTSASKPVLMTLETSPFIPVDASAADDEANLLAEGSDEQVIEDDENALAGFDDPICWTHWLMIIGATTTIVYCASVIARRRNSIKKFDDFENEVLGISDKRTATAAQRGVAYNAYQSM